MLRAHFAAPDHTLTWHQLASAVGYPSSSAVNLQYGIFARGLANELGLAARPRGFWLFVLADWADGPGPKGHTAFRMRPQVLVALQRLGWVLGAPPPSLLDTDDSAIEGRPQLRLVAHRHREASLRAARIARARKDSPDGKLRCSIPGCGFCFEEVYGEEAANYIQVHHLLPLGRRSGPVRTHLSDLALVCANCHAMIHYLQPAPALAALVPQASRTSDA